MPAPGHPDWIGILQSSLNILSGPQMKRTAQRNRGQECREEYYSDHHHDLRPQLSNFHSVGHHHDIRLPRAAFQIIVQNNRFGNLLHGLEPLLAFPLHGSIRIFPTDLQLAL
jgi:hypothetical protein